MSKNDLSCPACQASTIITISMGDYLKIDHFQCNECSYDFMAERPPSGKSWFANWRLPSPDQMSKADAT